MKVVWKFLVIALLCSFRFSSHGQSSQIFTVDSLFQSTQNSSLPIDSILAISNEIYQKSRRIDYDFGVVKSELLKGIYYYKKSQLDTAASFFLKVIDATEQAGKATYEGGRAHNFLGLIYQRLNSFERAQTNFDKSVQIFRALGNELYMVMSINNVGANYGMRGEYPQALEAFLEVLTIAESGKLSDEDAQDRQIKALTNISIIYSLMGQNERAKEIAKNALELNRSLGDSIGITYSYLNLGEICEDIRELDSAIYYYNLALNVATSRPEKASTLIVAGKQKLASVYFKQGDSERAAREIESLLSHQQATEKYGIEDSYSLLAKYYLNDSNLPQALHFSRLAFREGIESGAKRTIRSASKKLADIFYRMKRYDSAYHYLSLEKTYSDSIFNDSNERKFSNLRIEFETSEQQREIEKLKAEKELENSRRKMRIFAFAFVITLLVAVIIILIYRAKNIRKKQTISELRLQQQLQQKETELQQQTLHMINLNNNMAEVEERLKEVKKKETLSKQDVQKVLSNISIKKSMGEEWNKFESYFANIHSEFSDELLAKHSNLSRQERRLIALIKMDLSNREIANLFNIEPRSVSMNKYRLKQKLGLTENDDLEEYINQLFGISKN